MTKCILFCHYQYIGFKGSQVSEEQMNKILNYIETAKNEGIYNHLIVIILIPHVSKMILSRIDYLMF